MVLSPEQRGAFEHVTSARGISNVVGYAGTGKSAMLGLAREAWESAGYTVQGAALSGIAAENLESGSGMASRTIASLEHQWGQGRELLTDKSILVIDEAGMIGTRQMERVITEAEKRGAKVVLVGDPEQLQAIEAGASFRSIAEQHGAVEITTIRRQNEGWQRDATRQLATGRTDQALAAYEQAGHVHAAETRGAAREELIDRWDRGRMTAPQASRIILTHTNDEVRELNEAARGRMRAAQMLGEDVGLAVERGERSFASGDRVLFLKNERSLEVKNGTLGTVEEVNGEALQEGNRARLAVLACGLRGLVPGSEAISIANDGAFLSAPDMPACLFGLLVGQPALRRELTLHRFAPQDQHIYPGVRPSGYRVLRHHARAARGIPRLHPWKASCFQLGDHTCGYLAIKALTVSHNSCSFPQPPWTGARVAGGGRSRPRAPPAKGGAHLTRLQRSGRPGSEADGLRAAEAGLRGSDAPRHLDAEGPTPTRHQRGV